MTSYQQQIDQRIVEPTGVHGLPNGQFPDSVLYDVHDHTGKTVGRLCKVAANAWEAMVTAAWADGVALTPSSYADTYRPLTIQESIFADRYRSINQGNGNRTCKGRVWYLRKGKATAACPGTSNHGRGLAVDVANATGRVLGWLEDNAARYGFQWELAAEAWHIHYMPGDIVPEAVQHHGLTLLTPQPEDDDMKIIVPTGPGVPAGDLDQNFLCGNGPPFKIEGPAAAGQLTALIGVYGQPVKVNDLAWSAIRATGKAG